MIRVKSLSSTRWRKRTRGSKLEEDRDMMLSFSSCSSLFSGIFSSLTRRGNVAPPSSAWQRVKKRSRWLSWRIDCLICYRVILVQGAERETNALGLSACNASGRMCCYSRFDGVCAPVCSLQKEAERQSMCWCHHSPVCVQMRRPGCPGWKDLCDSPSTWLEGPEEEVSTRNKK